MKREREGEQGGREIRHRRSVSRVAAIRESYGCASSCSCFCPLWLGSLDHADRFRPTN